MQFSTAILAVLSLTTSIYAAPILSRDVPSVGAMTSALATLNTAVSADVSTISNLCATVTSDVSAEAEIAAQVNANIQGMITAVETATAAIVAQTNLTVTALTSADIVTLTADVQLTAQIIVNIQASLVLAVNAFTAESETLVMAEVAAAVAVLEPFYSPLNVYAAAVTGTADTAGTSLVAQLYASVATAAQVEAGVMSALAITIS